MPVDSESAVEVRAEATLSLSPERDTDTSPAAAALAPVRSQFKPAALKQLTHALALVIGTEAMVVCKDVLQLDDADARKVKRWAIRALIEAARKSPAAG